MEIIHNILPDTKQSSTQIVEYIKIHKPFLTLNCDDITTKESKDFRLYFSIKAQRVSHASTKRIWPAFFMSKHDFRDCPSPLYFSFRSAPVRWLENNPHWWRHTDQPRSHKSRISAVTVKINTTCRLYLEMTFTNPKWQLILNTIYVWNITSVCFQPGRSKLLALTQHLREPGAISRRTGSKKLRHFVEIDKDISTGR